MSLSPYEMRNLLHHIMSGREFTIKKCQNYPTGYNIVSNNDRVSQVRFTLAHSACQRIHFGHPELKRSNIWVLKGGRLNSLQ